MAYLWYLPVLMVVPCEARILGNSAELLRGYDVKELGPDDFELARMQPITVPVIDKYHHDPIETEVGFGEGRETLPGSVWPTGVVYYTVSSVYTPIERSQIAKAGFVFERSSF